MTEQKHQLLVDDLHHLKDLLEVIGAQQEILFIIEEAIEFLDLEIERMPWSKSLDEEAIVQMAYEYYRMREKYFSPKFR